MGSEVMTYQKFQMNLTSRYLARAARWPPTPTCSWWWTWATLQWLFSIFFSGSDYSWSRDTLVTIFRFSYHFQTYGDHMSSPLKFISRFWQVPFWGPSRSHASVHVRSTWHKWKLLGMKLLVHRPKNECSSMSGYASMTIIVLKYPEKTCAPDPDIPPLWVQYFRDHGRYH